MASTRISNDKIRIHKRLQESTDVSRHVMNVPGNGLDIPFIENPHVRMQGWGANRVDDIIGVENSLMNIDRPLIRECHDNKDSYYTKPNMNGMQYSTRAFETMDSHMSQPAWNLRGVENKEPHGFPIDNGTPIETPFNTNLGTRMHEKDLYTK
jgi:hypothetical protein